MAADQAGVKHLQLEFVTPDRAIVLQEVDEVEIPGEEGYFGVLPGHAPLLAALQPGTLWYRVGGERHYAFVSGGFAEVLPDRVSILAPVAERAEDIDRQRAEAAKRRAEERLARPMPDADFERARIALLKAISRLQIAEHSRHRG
jgi:F-type H+-transporting ATPase subunit epsilon